MESHETESVIINPLQEEQKHLTQVLGWVRARLNTLRATSKYHNADDQELSEPQTADEVAQEIVDVMRADQIDALERSSKEPYFGRIDFLDSQDRNLLALYIGKRGVEETGSGDRLVIDWRAPVASLFYSFSGKGDYASYEAPDGLVEGQVFLKRNIVVRDGDLQRVVDSYVKGQDNLGVTDEFLLYRLGENKDSRLRDIVSTIQAEQDQIIRAKRERTVFIQGVAGSGKTTVALHRLAYILYEQKGQLRADRMAIFAPNAMFVDYISEVLPELGVGGIKQTTFATWALEVLEFAVSLREPGRRLEGWFSLHKDLLTIREHEVAQFKGSRDFIRKLDDHVTNLEQNALPDEDFEPWDGIILSRDAIRKWFTEDYNHYPLAQRKARVLARVKRWYEMEYKNAKPDDPKKTIKRIASQRLKAYEHRWPDLSPLTLYQDLLSQFGLQLGTAPSGKKARSKRPEVEMEDLAPVLYLHQKLNGMDPRDRFDHVVIDEAQDFSPLQLEVLKGYCPSLSFTILGDLSQSIHTYQGITTWQSFLELFPKDKADFYQLDVSYRSTTEIIEFANGVLARFPGFNKAQPVFRSGEPVRVTRVERDDRWSKTVAAVRQLKAGAHTVAVVCRTESESKAAHENILAAGLEAQLIDVTQTEYQGGISVLPVYLTKGLEFDAVLLLGVDAEHYDQSPLSAKLLYVGCTRALHKLWIQYCGEPSPLLQPLDSEQREEDCVS